MNLVNDKFECECGAIHYGRDMVEHIRKFHPSIYMETLSRIRIKEKDTEKKLSEALKKLVDEGEVIETWDEEKKEYFYSPGEKHKGK